MFSWPIFLRASRFYSEPDIDSFNSSIVKVVEKHGETLMLQREENITNDEVINYLKGMNLRIRWIEPTNQIERKYLELIN